MDDSGGELAEESGATAEKDDGSKELYVRDTLAWEGHDEAVTKVFTTASAFKSFFGKNPPSEIDFTQEWAIYFAAGPRNTGGYEANILKVQLSATGRTVTVTTETVSPGNACLVAPALTSPATLVTIKKQTSTRFQTRKKQLTLACSAVCGDDLAANLEYGSRGATYYSEADEPYVPVAFAGAGGQALTKERFLSLLGRAATTNIDEQDWASWIERHTMVEPNADEFDQAAAKEHEEMRIMVERQLTDVKVFDVGFEDNGDGVRPLYIIGTTKCGDLAGYKTTIVAT
jgi:hypothetical protein